MNCNNYNMNFNNIFTIEINDLLDMYLYFLN